MKTFGEQIRELREKKDLSVRELAKRIKVTPPFLSDVELGRRHPSEDVLGKLGMSSTPRSPSSRSTIPGRRFRS